MKFGIGQGVRRTEDPVLVTGRGRYTDDEAAPGALRGVVLRSPVAHGRIRRLDTEAARAAAGVAAVLTHDEIAADGIGNLLCLVEVKNGDGSDRADTPRPLLANGIVRHVGDPVAFVVADTLAHARDAAELIDLEIDDLPAVTDTYGAAQAGAPQVWEHIDGNLAFDFAAGDEAAVEAAFAAAAHRVSLRLVNNRLVSNAMEPRAAIAEFDADSGRSTLTLPSQGPVVPWNQLCGMLKLKPEQLRCVTRNVGGGFGTKAFLYPEAALTLWASRRLQRDVRWTGERSEIFLSDAQGRDHVSEVELALDADGRFLGLRATTYAALGAYLANFGPMIPTNASVGMYTGLYRIPAFHVAVKGVMTNTVPTDAYRGAGRPEAAYMIERLVDKAAAELGIAPDELRRRNFPPPEAMPHKMGLGDVIDSGEFAAIMEEAMGKADWRGFAGRRTEARARGRLRGIGLATYVERCGGGGMAPAALHFAADGRLEIRSGTLDSGQGHAVAFAQILSEKLGIDADRIVLRQGDTDSTPPGFTGGSKSIPVGGASILGAADKVIAKGKALAAERLEAAEVDIAYDDGAFTVVGTDRGIGLFELAQVLEPGALDADHDHTAEAPTFPNGAHVCELEVDPETGRIEICRYTVVDDFGVTLNPLLLEGQVQGGIAQGLGQAWTEHTVYDPENGQLLTGSFMDYALPRADEMPAYDFSTHNVRCRTNPLGVKGAGEAGSIGAPPAFVNAVVDALRSARPEVAHIDMPTTPEKVWRALQAA